MRDKLRELTNVDNKELDKLIKKIIYQLHNYTKTYDNCCLGLPLSAEHIENMQELVKQILLSEGVEKMPFAAVINDATEI